eukprot:535709-Ditylum_brightwellii.AAC.1
MCRTNVTRSSWYQALQGANHNYQGQSRDFKLFQQEIVDQGLAVRLIIGKYQSEIRGSHSTVHKLEVGA